MEKDIARCCLQIKLQPKTRQLTTTASDGRYPRAVSDGKRILQTRRRKETRSSRGKRKGRKRGQERKWLVRRWHQIIGEHDRHSWAPPQPNFKLMDELTSTPCKGDQKNHVNDVQRLRQSIADRHDSHAHQLIMALRW